MIASTAIIHPNVELGDNVVIEDYCIIGAPFKGYSQEKTFIGDNAIIRSGTVIYAGNVIGDNFQAGNKANVRELNEIGKNVSIGTLAVVEHHVKIEDGVRIHSQAFIPEFTILERNCWIGPNVVITNARFPKHPSAKEDLLGVCVQENAKVGAHSTLLPGITVGKNALIGAGSVVTKNVMDGVIVAGNPASILREIDY
jgi:acetyltransferase-like isoleucine patch superfamily enzyme